MFNHAIGQSQTALVNFKHVEVHESTFDSRVATTKGQQSVVDAGRRTLADIDAAPILRLREDQIPVTGRVERAARAESIIQRRSKDNGPVGRSFGNKLSTEGRFDASTFQFDDDAPIDTEPTIDAVADHTQQGRDQVATVVGAVIGKSGIGRLAGRNLANQDVRGRSCLGTVNSSRQAGTSR